MSALAVIRREGEELKKRLIKLENELSGLVVGSQSSEQESKLRRNYCERVLSAAGRVKISKAARKRWAKIRAKAKKDVA
jgi:hypothetical protein